MDLIMESSNKHLGQSVLMAALLVLASAGIIGMVSMF